MDLASQVDAVDAAIRRFPWLDLELESSSRWVASVLGYIDPSADPDLRITFRDIAALALPTEWKTDTKNRVFREVLDAPAFEFNKRYGVERGYVLFEFIPEDMECACIIAAKSVELELLRKE